MAKADNLNEGADWLAVIARTLAYLCLHSSEQRDKRLLDQSDFLSRFGLSRKECARVLGTTEASLNELARQARKVKNASGKGRSRKR